MSDATDNQFDFMRQMWSSIGFGLPGMATPSFDGDEIAKRITDLKAVEGWLKMNLSMLQMTIQGLEVQQAALAAVRAMGEMGRNASAPEAPPSAPETPNFAEAFSNPALWTWPFQAMSAASEATATSPAPAPNKPATKPRTRSSKKD